MAYWDTSCLLKLYAHESDSADFEAHVLSGSTLVTSAVARLELYAALHRKETANDLQPGGANRAMAAYDADVSMGLISVKVMDSVVVKRFETIIERCYHQPVPLPLRTLDAIHVATAFSASETEMVATDKRLRQAALNMGLAVFPL